MKEREGNFDLLRIVSAIAVIMIHVSATWFNGAVSDIADGLQITDIQSPVWICIYNSISRFAVPCFVMLSGAFILDNEKNAEYKKFYSKSFQKIGVPTIIFNIIYILYRLPQYLLGKYIVDDTKNISILLKDIVKGAPYYHMWYLYMLIGVYALAPIVLRFKNSVSEKSFYKIAFIFLVLANISRWTTGSVKLNWSVGQAFEYLGYFMTGYSVRKLCRRKSNAKALLMICLGLLLELGAAGIECYWQIPNGIAESDLKYRIVSPYCPLIVPASVLIFYGFTLLDVKKEFTGLPGLTFYIYLIHAGVWDFIGKVFRLLKGKAFLTSLDGAVWIPVFVVIVFVISVVLSKIYLWLWAKIDREKRVTNWLARAVHLQGNVD